MVCKGFSWVFSFKSYNNTAIPSFYLEANQSWDKEKWTFGCNKYFIFIHWFNSKHNIEADFRTLQMKTLKFSMVRWLTEITQPANRRFNGTALLSDKCEWTTILAVWTWISILICKMRRIKLPTPGGSCQN